MAAIYSNGGNRWNILGNFTKRDALSSVYKISMMLTVVKDWVYTIKISVITVEILHILVNCKF
jgi:hypothetical protein